jgi:hypothetical protein
MKFPQDQGNKMSNWPQCESKAWCKAPVKEKQGEKSEVKIEKIMPNEAYGDEVYLSSLIFDPTLKI